MNSAGLKKAKRRVRAEVRALRDAVPEEHRERLAGVISDRFLALPELGGARTVMAFWSFGSEVPTEGLVRRLHAGGHRVALPRIVDDELEPRTYVPDDPVTMAPFGAGEPAGGEPLAPAEIDVAVTPGIAFDRRGARVGYGGGYYDRFFRRARSDMLRAAICLSVQLVEGPLPTGPLDLPVDLVVTESEIVRIPRGR